MTYDMNDVLEKLLRNEISLKEIDDMVSTTEAQKIKLRFLEKKLNQDLSIIGEYSVNAEKLKNKNIENFIGTVEIPVGFAGPINIKSGQYQGEHYIPIATTEGALVASISRGCKVLSADNFVSVTSKYNGATRSPLFLCNDIDSCINLKKWIEGNYELWKSKAESQSNHLKILKFDISTFANKLWLRINFDTDEAMGMNMVSIASGFISECILENNSSIKLISLSGNLCADKKPALINSLQGRGYDVEAQCLIRGDVLEKYLHVSGKELADINRLKVWYGGALAGSLGFNSQAANVIAGIYAATGQDIAQIVDSSINYVSFEESGKDLLLSVKIPSLMIGTVGGGTGISKQKTLIDFMLSDINNNNFEGKKSKLIAELIGASVLAGELSLNAALASQNFLQAHKKLGRGI
jgi:hydroxymethylglutaryl-CoA reductase (NADPH)